MNEYKSWQEMLNEFDDYIFYCTMSKRQLKRRFDPYKHNPKDAAFTAWSDDYVYFPGTYDGDMWVDRVPRNPCPQKTDPVGGGLDIGP